MIARALVRGFVYIDRASLDGISVVEILRSASGRGELAEMKIAIASLGGGRIMN